MEAGYGSLDDWYYIVFHNSYKSDAHEKNKAAQRLATDLATIPQVEYADSIQEALKERAEEEMKIIIDNTVDAAGYIEKTKLTDLLMNFQILLYPFLHHHLSQHGHKPTSECRKNDF